MQAAALEASAPDSPQCGTDGGQVQTAGAAGARADEGHGNYGAGNRRNTRNAADDMARTIYDLAEQDELPGGSLQYSHVHIPTNGVPLVRYFQEYLQLGTWLVEPRGRRYEICGGIGISRAGFPCALLCLGAAYLRLEPPGAGRPTSDAASAPPLLRPRCRVTPGALASLPSWRVARGVPAPTRAAGRLHLASTPARVHLISGQRDSRRTHHTLPNPPLRCSASQPPASCPPPRTPHPCYSLPPLPRLRAPPWPPL